MPLPSFIVFAAIIENWKVSNAFDHDDTALNSTEEEENPFTEKSLKMRTSV